MARSDATGHSLDRTPVEATSQEFQRRGFESLLPLTVALEVERIDRAVHAVVTALPALNDAKLTVAGWQALTALSFHPHKEMPTAKLALRVGIHPTTITRTIDRLERLGYVARVRPDHDRRVTTIALLRAGEEAQLSVAAALDDACFGMAEVPEELLEELVGGLRVLREKMEGKLSVTSE